MLKKNHKNPLNGNKLRVLIVILIFLVKGNAYQQQNLLINGDFSMTNLSGRSYKYFNSSITGWNCTNTCQVDDCLLLNQYWTLQGSYNANCTGLVVDLISDGVQNLTQNIVLDSQPYLLSLNYYYPRVNAHLKTFQVYFNEVKIFNFTPNASFLYLPQYLQQQVQGISGVNTLRLTTKRNDGFDVFGFTVNNIRLSKMKNSLKSLVNNTILNNFTVFLAQVPGSRVFLADFMTFFVNFDRLQFYYFHNRSYSQYSTVLLADINVLNGFKGLFFQSIIYLANPDLSDKIDSFFASIDYKFIYTPKIIQERNGNKGGGFINNCYSFFVYTFPGTIITYFIFLGLFKLVRKRPASRLIRKFSIIGILITMILQGNIESLTYYSIGEMTLFFSANLQHRLINVFVVFFQLIVTILAVGSVLFLKYHYKRLIFYLIDDKRSNHLGIFCQTVDGGVICLLFGIIHQILFSRPQSQLFVLLLLEVFWMAFKVCFIFNKTYTRRITQFIMFKTGLVRVCFIITFYFYDDASAIKGLINGSIHKNLVIMTLLLWLYEFIVSLLQLLIFYLRFFIRLKLFYQKKKLAQQRMQSITPFRDQLRKINKNTNEQIIRSNQATLSNLMKPPHRAPILKLQKNERSFKPKKVHIALDRIQRIFNFNHNTEEFK